MAALVRCDGKKAALPDGTTLALAPGPTRSTPYTKQSVAKAVAAAVGGSARDGATARKAAAAEALVTLDRQARAAGPKTRRKRDGAGAAAPVAKRGRWAKA